MLTSLKLWLIQISKKSEISISEEGKSVIVENLPHFWARVTKWVKFY